MWNGHVGLMRPDVTRIPYIELTLFGANYCNYEASNDSSRHDTKPGLHVALIKSYHPPKKNKGLKIHWHRPDIQWCPGRDRGIGSQLYKTETETARNILTWYDDDDNVHSQYHITFNNNRNLADLQSAQ